MEGKIMLKKRVTGVLILITLLIGACGKSAEDNIQQEKNVKNVQEEEMKSETDLQTVDNDQKEEPTSTPIPTPEKEEIVLPEIGDEYEYHLYCLGCIDDSSPTKKKWTNPCIGINTLEGWEISSLYMYSITEDKISDSEKAEPNEDEKIIKIVCKENIDNENIYLYDIQCISDDEKAVNILSPEYNNHTDVDFLMPRVISKEKMASINTEFGEVEVYWVCKGYNSDAFTMNFYYEGKEFDQYLEENPDAKYEENGIVYLLMHQEVASLEIGEHRIQIRIDNVMAHNFNKEYKGQLEKIIPQLFVAKQ